MIKMIVTDLDDTLFRKDKSISQYTLKTIERVRQRGIKFIFATARGSSTQALVPFQYFDGYVLLNGAKAYVNKKLVYQAEISPNSYGPLLQKLSSKNLRVAAEIDGIHFSNFNVKEKWDYIDNFIISDYRDITGGADKLYALVDDPKDLDIIQANLPKELYLNLSRDGLAMIMHKKARKFKGITGIADCFNIASKEILAFGDDINDKEMLVRCGTGVAMANGLKEIKEIADYICDTNDNDGLAKWLDKNIDQLVWVKN